MVRIAGRNKH